MAEQVEQDVRKLFKQWRGGDAQAGQAMAQRFSDWYYAITAVRLGDTAGRVPLEKACQSFAQGIVGVARSAELVDWAHSLVATELEVAGSRVKGGDFPNALTGERSPTALLAEVRPALSPDQCRLLHMAYGHGADLDALTEEAERLGGMPLALLQARYALKRALRDRAGIQLVVVPESPNLDLVPLPLYEAARMDSPEDERDFEQWLISDLELCQDVAEFATFSHALRAGAFGGEAPRSAAEPKGRSSRDVSGNAASSGTDMVEDTGGSKGSGLGAVAIVGGLLVVGLILAVLVGIAFFALR